MSVQKGHGLNYSSKNCIYNTAQIITQQIFSTEKGDDLARKLHESITSVIVCSSPEHYRLNDLAKDMKFWETTGTKSFFGFFNKIFRFLILIEKSSRVSE